MLFDPEPSFHGLPREGFELFGIEDRTRRRRAILETIHPSLEALGQDLKLRLDSRAAEPLHAHLPKLDWPREYQPFCTWLALSRHAQGYQAGPQLNVGVHADHVAVRLGWDTRSAAFGRFEFIGRYGELHQELPDVARELDLRFRVYAAAAWPVGSRLVLDTASDLDGSFDEVGRRGVWWELGRRWELPEALDFVCSPELGTEAGRILEGLLPLYERL